MIPPTVVRTMHDLNYQLQNYELTNKKARPLRKHMHEGGHNSIEGTLFTGAE